MSKTIVMLARTYTAKTDPSGWWMSEKLDGIRAYWTGSQFLTRTGRRINAPAWFCAGLPTTPLDGELWCGHGGFDDACAITIGNADPESWREITFHVFDAPEHNGTFEQRLAVAEQSIVSAKFAIIHPHTVCQSRQHLAAELARVESIGGEGIMLRKPKSAYESKRTASLLKVKSFDDAEAIVISTEPTSMLVDSNGIQFALGYAGRDIPAVGSLVTFRYQGFTSYGIPRFAYYLRPATNLQLRQV